MNATPLVRRKRWKMALLLLGSMLVIVLAGGLASGGNATVCWVNPHTGLMSRVPINQACVPIPMPEPQCHFHPEWCNPR